MVAGYSIAAVLELGDLGVMLEVGRMTAVLAQEGNPDAALHMLGGMAVVADEASRHIHIRFVIGDATWTIPVMIRSLSLP